MKTPATTTRSLIARVTDRLSGRANDLNREISADPKRQLVIEALEPRILFSGSPAPAPEPTPVAEPVVQEAPAPTQEAESSPTPDANSGESVAVPPQATESPTDDGETAVVLTPEEQAAIDEASQYAAPGFPGAVGVEGHIPIVEFLNGETFITNHSPLTISSDFITTGGFTFTASDDAFDGPGMEDHLTVTGAGTDVEDDTSLTLNGGDNVDIQSGTTVKSPQVTLNIDFGNADVGGGMLLLNGSVDSTSVAAQAVGDSEADTFLLDGISLSDITLIGNGGADTYDLIDLGGGTSTITVTGDGSDAVRVGGVGTGVFQFGDMAFSGAGDMEFEVNGTTPGTQHDQLVSSGTVDISGMNLQLSGTHVPSASGESFTLIESTGGITGTFAGLAEGATITNPFGSGAVYEISYVGGGGDDVVLTFAPTPAEYLWDDGSVDNTPPITQGSGDADQNWTTSTNWRVSNSGTVPPNDIVPGPGDRANIAFDSGTNNNGTVTTIAAMPAAGVGGAVELTAADNVEVRSVRIGSNPGLGYGGNGRLENNGGTITLDNSVAGIGNNFILGSDGDRSGVYIQDGGTLEMNGTPGHAVIVGASNGEGFFGLIDGTVNADVSGFRLAENGASRGSLVMDGGTLNVSGGNFETANQGVGVATVNDGNLNVNSNNLIVGQANSSNATLNINGGTVDLQNQLRVSNNASTGTVTMTGGTVNVGTVFAVSDHGGGGAGTSTVDISGGTLNISDRANGGWLIGSTNNAASSADVTVSGTADVNVIRTGVRIADRGANSVGTLTQTGGTIDVAGGNTETADNGTGTIEITGGTFNQNTNNFIVGQEATSDATLLVGGTGTLDIHNDFNIANRGTGLVEISGGVVNVGNRLQMAANAAADSDATVKVSGGTLNVGERVNPGGTNNSDLIIGGENRAGSTSLFEVSGIGVVRVGDQIRVAQTGVNSSGTLDIQDGIVDARAHVIIGVVGTGDATISGGTLTVGADLPTAAPSDFSGTLNTGDNGAQLLVGTNNGSVGTLTQTGGTVHVGDTTGNNSNDVVIARDNGSDGTYTISAGLLSINDSAGNSGDLTIAGNENGATTAKGALNVSGTADIDIDGRLRVGQEGDGDMTMSGGTVDVGSNWILGQGGSADGTASITGGTVTVNGVTDVGQAGSGSVTIGGTGIVDMTNGRLSVGRNAGSTGELVVESTGTLDNVSNLEVGFNGAGFALLDGTVNATTVNVNVDADAVDAGILRGSGTITGNLLVQSNGVLETGTTDDGLATGSSEVGTLSIIGNASLLAGSAFNVDIDGPNSDLLDVDGIVTLGGTLNVVSGADPTLQFITIIDNDGGDAVSGTFAGLAEGAAVTVGSLSYAITYVGGDGNDVVLFDPNVETSVTIDAAGDLVVEDIMDTTTDDTLTISSDGTNIIISDPNQVLGMDFVGASRPDVHTIIVPFALPFDDIIVLTNDGEDVITVTDLTNFGQSLTIDGGGTDGAVDLIDFRANGVGLGGESYDFNAEKVFFQFDSSITVATSGTIDITATGGTGDFMGIQLKGTSLTSDAGDITLDGAGGDTGNTNDGVHLSHGSSITTTGGNVGITGTATSTAGANDGVSILGSSDITVGGTGNIDITGTSSGTSYGIGVQLFTGTELTTAGGNISLTGTSVSTGGGNSGIYTNGATVTAAGAGTVALSGTGSGAGGSNIGLRLTKTTIGADSGAVVLTGSGGGGTKSNEGVQIGVATSVSSASGDVTVTGTGNGSTTKNSGVTLLSGADVSGNNVTVTGSGGNGTSVNYGVSLSSASISAANDLTVTGTGNGSANYNRGIYATKSAIVAGADANVTGNGSATAGGKYNDGVYLKTVTLTADTLALTGNSGTGSSNNRGVYVYGSTVTGATSFNIAGTSNGAAGTGNTGVSMAYSSLSDTGTITGDGGGAGRPNYGVYMHGITTGLDPVNVTGTAVESEDDKFGNFFSILPLLMAEADRRANRRKSESKKTGDTLRSLLARLGRVGSFGEFGNGETPVFRSIDGIISVNPDVASDANLDQALAAAGIENLSKPAGSTGRALVLHGGDHQQLSGFVIFTDKNGEILDSRPLCNPEATIKITIAEFLSTLAETKADNQIGWSRNAPSESLQSPMPCASSSPLAKAFSLV